MGVETGKEVAPGTGVAGLLQRAKRAFGTIGWTRPGLKWTEHLFAVVVAAVSGVVLVIATFPEALERESARDAVLAIVGMALVAYALVRAIVAVFGPRPRGLCRREHTAWRIAWSVGAVSLMILVLANVMFGLNDHMRAQDRDGQFCADDAQQPTALGAPIPTSDPGANLAEEPTTEEAFGFDRGVQSTSFVVTAVDGSVGDLQAADFRALSEDGRTAKSFAKVESVVPLSATEALVRLEIDLSCHAGMEGGQFAVRTVYLPTGGANPTLDHQSWNVDVTLQSRLLFYFLALVPLLVVGAIFQVFSVWPASLKRWFTSVIAILVPVLTAYRGVGLSNATWHQDPLTVAALIGATYAAAVTAANLVKNGGHDIDRPAPVDESSAVAGSDTGPAGPPVKTLPHTPVPEKVDGVAVPVG